MIKPLPGYVLVSPIVDEKSSGGLYLSDNGQDKPSKGKIVSLSKGYWLPDGMFHVNEEVIQDQVVIYKKWTNQEVEHEGKKYLLVKFDELLGVIE